MTRRVFAFLPLLRRPWLWPIGDPPKTNPVVDAANEFARVYRLWATIKQQEIDQPGTVAAGEIPAWEQVRHAWHDLDVVVRNNE